MHVKDLESAIACVNAMSEDPIPSNEVACPVCGRPMTSRIISRAFAEHLYTFECKRCGLLMTQPESSAPPAMVPDSRHKQVPVRRE
jgi:hypothetical protein